MQFAVSRKGSSHPQPWSVKRKPLGRQAWQVLVASLLSAVFGLYLLSRLFGVFHGSPSEEEYSRAPSGYPNVVLVTTIDPKMPVSLSTAVKNNRHEYAEKHGYGTFFPFTRDYPINDSPSTWAKVPAMRHAMTLYPKTPFFMFVDARTLIMNLDLSVEDHIMEKSRIESLMLQDVPIIPPDSVIRTFPRLKGEKIDLVMTQDKEGLNVNSFVLRRGEWAKFFLDVWFDPIYRGYNFQRAERHALEHVVQWHGTLLAKIGLVPQNILNSYVDKDAEIAGDNGLYKEGDFVLTVGRCEAEDRNCETELKHWMAKSRSKKGSHS